MAVHEVDSSNDKACSELPLYAQQINTSVKIVKSKLHKLCAHNTIYIQDIFEGSECFQSDL